MTTNTSETTTTPGQRIVAMSGPKRKARRLELGLTQQQVAVLSGVGLHTVHHWEYGVTPQPHRAEKYAAALEITDESSPDRDFVTLAEEVGCQ